MQVLCPLFMTTWLPGIVGRLNGGLWWLAMLLRALMEEAFERYKPFAVLHFAAFAYVGESVETPIKHYRNNVASTLILFEAMHDHGIKQMVFSSTCASYGVPLRVPINEAHPQNPINLYGMSKLMVEQLLLDCGFAYRFALNLFALFQCCRG